MKNAINKTLYLWFLTVKHRIDIYHQYKKEDPRKLILQRYFWFAISKSDLDAHTKSLECIGL